MLACCWQVNPPLGGTSVQVHSPGQEQWPQVTWRAAVGAGGVGVPREDTSSGTVWQQSCRAHLAEAAGDHPGLKAEPLVALHTAMVYTARSWWAIDKAACVSNGKPHASTACPSHQAQRKLCAIGASWRWRVGAVAGRLEHAAGGGGGGPMGAGVRRLAPRGRRDRSLLPGLPLASPFLVNFPQAGWHSRDPGAGG